MNKMNEVMSAVSQQLASQSAGEKAETLRGVISTLSPPEKEAMTKALSGVLAPPGDRTKDAIWLIVIGAFSLVLVGAALVLGLGVFREISDATKQVTRTDTILTVFTTVVGFLAGLLSPSPLGRNG